jgi:hypothetical protein
MRGRAGENARHALRNPSGRFLVALMRTGRQPRPVIEEIENP